jgi:hypothetical protein
MYGTLGGWLTENAWPIPSLSETNRWSIGGADLHHCLPNVRWLRAGEHIEELIGMARCGLQTQKALVDLGVRGNDEATVLRWHQLTGPFKCLAVSGSIVKTHPAGIARCCRVPSHGNCLESGAVVADTPDGSVLTPVEHQAQNLVRSQQINTCPSYEFVDKHWHFRCQLHPEPENTTVSLRRIAPFYQRATPASQLPSATRTGTDDLRQQVADMPANRFRRASQPDEAAIPSARVSTPVQCEGGEKVLLFCARNGGFAPEAPGKVKEPDSKG